ncbi:MAG: flavodoxin FldA [Rikenellaceae bacterium]
MKATIVVYGSTTGTCNEIAQSIASQLGVEAIEVTSLNEDVIAENDNLILGTSTWGAGELQDDWYDGIKVLESADLSGKTVALFGCGDSSSYCDTFCDGIGIIYEAVKGAGATVVGSVATDGYSYDASTAEVDGVFVGLPLDNDNESSKTDKRIDAWIKSIKELL